jgi:hypothetical protein
MGSFGGLLQEFWTIHEGVIIIVLSNIERLSQPPSTTILDKPGAHLLDIL